MTVKQTISRRVDGVYTDVEVDLTEDQLAEHNAALNKPKVKRRECEFREFLGVFTTAEQVAIKTAAMNPANVALALWYDKALGGATMSLDHSATTDGLDALVAAGLIDADRKAEILATDFDLI